MARCKRPDCHSPATSTDGSCRDHATPSKLTRGRFVRAVASLAQWRDELDARLIQAHDDGWTQAELADAAGMTQQTVSKALARARKRSEQR